MSDLSITEVLSQRLVHWREEGLSPEILATARLYLLDWLGSALAGLNTEPGKILQTYARAQPAGQCTVLGSAMQRSAEAAALVNGALSHIVEMDDLDRGSVVHPGAVVIPAALAVAERERATGNDLLSAIVAGYEVAIRIGEAVGKGHYYYFHNTSTCGIFGATAAAGWILGLDAERLVWALGNAGTQSSGLWQFNEDGDMSKHLHAGMAAAGGVLSADLAAKGFTGARKIMEGDRGFFAAMAPGANPNVVLEGIDDSDADFRLSGVSIKPHASCRHTHPSVDAALRLREQISGRVSHVRIDSYKAALDLCDNPTPRTPYEAKFSLQFCVASALCQGHVGLSDFTDQAIWNEEIRALLPAIEVAVLPEYEARYPSEWSAAVHVVTTGGDELSASVNHPKGDPENPMTKAELESKFLLLAGYGGQDKTAARWLQWITLLGTEPTLVPH